MLNEKKYVTPALLNSIISICEFVVKEARSNSFCEDDLFHIELAVDEACTNIIEHAYGGKGIGEIRVICGTDQLNGEEYFVVRLRDQGEPFDPDGTADPDSTSESEMLKVGGFGMRFMRRSMDRIEFRFQEGWNELVMRKKVEREKK